MKSLVLIAFAASAAWNAPAGARNLQSDLMTSERAMWNGWKNRDATPFRRLLTPEAVQVVTGTGVLRGREAVAAYMATPSCRVRSFSLSKPTLKMLSASIALLSYSAAQDVSCAGVKLPRKLVVTAIYLRKGTAWRASSYQETPVD